MIATSNQIPITAATRYPMIPIKEMPKISGGETFDRLKVLNPAIKVILCSGYSIDGQASEILKRGCKAFIQKPFNLKTLSHHIRAVLNNR